MAKRVGGPGEGPAEGPAAGQTPDRTRLFLIWDSEIRGIRMALRTLRGVQVDRLQVTILGLDANDGDVLNDLVLKGIDDADRIAALVDLPNVNVGFEIGYALAKRKTIRLLRWGGNGPPDWTRSPPLAGQLITETGRSDRLRARLQEEGEGATLPSSLPVSNDRRETLLLSPREGVGHNVREHLLDARELGWRTVRQSGWGLPELGRQLDSVRRVVWVLVPYPEGADSRDGAENASAAVIAGFAFGLGIDLRIWADREFTRWPNLDVAGKAEPFTDERDLDVLIDDLDRPTPDAKGAPLDAYRTFLLRRHARLVPFFHDATDSLDDVYVELELRHLDRESIPRRMATLEKGSLTLRSLLDDATERRCFALLGDPGAGKSTICRRLSFSLASDLGDHPQGPIPLFVPLVKFAAAPTDPFGVVAQELAEVNPENCARFAESLRQIARESDRIWILLDGLDEVAEEKVDDVRTRIAHLAAEYPRCRIVVTARTIAYVDLHPFYRATVQPLDRAGQRTLLCKWLGDAQGDHVLQHLTSIPALYESASNPLVLTLVAMLSRAQRGLPATRVDLYGRAIDLLLERGHGLRASKGVPEPTVARELLAALSLELSETPGEAWTQAEVIAKLIDDVAPKDEKIARRLQMRGGAERFLNEVATQSGILADHGDQGGKWRFLHRSLREFLAAERLHQLGPKEYQARAVAIGEKRPDVENDDVGARVAHWGETFAMLCGLAQTNSARIDLLETLRDANHALALRALPTVEGLTSVEVLDFLDQTKGWNGDLLLRVVQRQLGQGTPTNFLHDLLMERVKKTDKTESLAYLYYAMELSHVGVEREAFFDACGRTARKPTIAVKELPGGTFQMGSPEDVGDGDEHPPHDVTLSPFALGITTITEPEYAAFDRNHVDHPRDGYPVVRVSWWEAWLFSRWIGGSLPTEAQWEYACRAGSDTAWSFGDEKSRLEDYAWYGDPGGKPRPVGKKLPNAFGLYDMHGNVWEWCSDRYGEYAANPAGSAANVAADPTGPDTGADRVLRGGVFWVDAVRSRSACRGWNGPGNRDVSIGFRVAFPARAVRSRP